MDKRGLGDVVTAILIILLVLGAVVIVWQVVKGTLKEGEEQVAAKTDCIGIQLEITDAVYDADADTETVSVTRQAGGPDGQVSVVVLLDGVSKIAAGNDLGQLESDDFVISDVTAEPSKIDVAAKIGENACDIADTYS